MRISILPILLAIPATLYSTDIYHSSSGSIQIRANLNPLIVPGTTKLNSTVLIISAPRERKNLHIITKCEHRESTLYSKGDSNGKILSVIQVYFTTPCEDQGIRVGDSEYIFTDTNYTLPLKSIDTITTEFVNTSSTELLALMRALPNMGSERKDTTIVEKLQRIQALYKKASTETQSDLAQSILVDRLDAKYISPVGGYSLPNKDILIPGANRGYRMDTTDGVHHGWDIMAPHGTPVQALSKGKIIRIVDDWNWGYFNILKKGDLSDDDKLTNLDIFRGNQIWLQTMDGNVVFYSHLSKISPSITVGTSVKKGEYIGNIGVSGVPEKHYKNIHLHFEIQKNPFHQDIKNHNFLDIMRWSYLGNGLKNTEVLDQMLEIFE